LKGKKEGNKANPFQFGGDGGSPPREGGELTKQKAKNLIKEKCLTWRGRQKAAKANKTTEGRVKRLTKISACVSFGMQASLTQKLTSKIKGQTRQQSKTRKGKMLYTSKSARKIS